MSALEGVDAPMIENRTFDEISVGDSASSTREVTREDIELFAVVSGDVNPAHLDSAYAQTTTMRHVVAHGMLGAALISSVLGVKLPGAGAIYLGQELRFLRPVAIGDVITSTVTVREKLAEKGDLTLDCDCVNQRGETVIGGIAYVRAPREKVRRAPVELPDVRLRRHDGFRALLEAVRENPAQPAAVAHPCDADSIAATVAAAEAGLIEPILIGPRGKIERAAQAARLDVGRFRLIDAPHSVAAAAAAVALARSGEAKLLLKGSIRAEELLHAALDGAKGLTVGRRLSHVYALDVPAYPRPLLLTDAAINIEPDLEQKRDIIQNAIDLARVIGVATPRVALLSAIETVNSHLRSTLDAASLCKMAERGQISGGVVDGPLAFDSAISPEAAASKGVVSEVAGRADVLVAPNLEAGDMLAKQLTFFAGADAAGVVVGGRVPIVFAGRADSAQIRLASCAIAALLAFRAANPTAAARLA